MSTVADHRKVGRSAVPAVASRKGSARNAPWPMVRIKDVATSIQYGLTASAAQRADGPRFLRITDIQDGRVDWDSVPGCEIPPDQVSKYRLASGDLVFARTGATTGKSFLIGECPEAVFASYLIRVRVSTGVDSRYLAAFFQSPDYWQQIEAGKRGIGQPNVNGSVLGEVQFPLPPLPEQRRIVAEIEKQFTRLDAGIAALRRTQANLKRYRAAVLKAACEGRLVPTEADLARKERRKFESAAEIIARTPQPPRPNRWNSRSKDLILGHSALAVGNPNTPLPAGWAWVPLVDIARMESGHTPSRTHPEWWQGKIPWIGIADAREHDGRTILDTEQHTNDDGLANSAARLLPAGAVCISRTASVGYVVVIGREMATSQDFVNWIPTRAVASDWLRIIFSADREGLRKFGKGSVHKTIYFPEWLSMHIALPPPAEQKRIALEVERILSLVERVASASDANMTRAGGLRQAILRAAISD